MKKNNLKEVMHDGSRMYIAVPNSLTTNRGRDWYRIAHTYYFSTYILVSILAKAGLKVEYIESDREELWCIVSLGKPQTIDTQSWLPSYQVEYFRKAFKYEHNRVYRIKTKLINWFKSL